MKLFQTTNKQKTAYSNDFERILESPEEVENWFRETLANYGQIGLCSRVINLLQEVQFARGGDSFSLDSLDAILCLNSLSRKEHLLDCFQYLNEPYLSYELKSKLCKNILEYSDTFCKVYSDFSSAVILKDTNESRDKLALIFARQMYYLCEHARFHMYNYTMPEESFWHTVNVLYSKVDSLNLETMPIHLFQSSERVTTVQDQFLILMMLSLLSEGNLTPRKINTAYVVLSKLSVHIEVQKEHSIATRFVIDLQKDKPVWRLSDEDLQNLKEADSLRYWDTSDLVIKLSEWSFDIDSGRALEELKNNFSGPTNPEFLRFLCREWASRPIQLTRSDRIEVCDTTVSVVCNFPFLHQVMREQTENMSASQNTEHFKEASIYSTKNRIDFYRQYIFSSKLKYRNWLLHDKSETGAGFTIDDNDLPFISLKTLFAYRESKDSQWSVCIVRRIQRTSGGQAILGVELLSSMSLPVSLIASENNLMPENINSNKWYWDGGLIGLFCPVKKNSKTISGLFLPTKLYAEGKTLIMKAKGNEFSIVIVSLLERGENWCLVETRRTKTS